MSTLTDYHENLKPFYEERVLLNRAGLFREMSCLIWLHLLHKPVHCGAF